ncbi:response regulator receiver domain-containing protein [Hypnocyclicus thermotrophus]|uniref:Response regulator receiver domain-containing protein n=1 Tax=Hypnocyclicus thermotrophus TaxID=1627895 RepID=A0AA46I5A6_9FUSO|nr:response regulator [Hypnocyclicus thermotrophus]TDT69733.1 response regulator receiver domain-containing protein [Hypnocyclicus thermotrophus]
MGKKILIVDDEKHILQIVKFNLEKKGKYEVVSANDGQEGYEVSIKEKPDLIISDIMMPRLTGLEMCKLIRENDEVKSIPLIILTAKGQDNYIEEGKKYDVTDFLTKPFSPRELLLKVREILGE